MYKISFDYYAGRRPIKLEIQIDPAMKPPFFRLTKITQKIVKREDGTSSHADHMNQTLVVKDGSLDTTKLAGEIAKKIITAPEFQSGVNISESSITNTLPALAPANTLGKPAQVTLWNNK